MTDRDFLIWVHQRLVNRHGESPFLDYMHFLRDIIHATPKDRRSKVGIVTMHSSDVLYEIRAAERKAGSA